MRTNEQTATWRSWTGHTTEVLHLGEESGGWTADGTISGLDVQYVVRLDAHWHVRQFLLFRDLDEPDLWLATDGSGRWGEMNGAHRPDLNGCHDIDLVATPFLRSIPMRRLALGLAVGESTEIAVAMIDPETLHVLPVRHRYLRTDERQWRHQTIDGGGDAREEWVVTLDEHDLPLDVPDRFRREPEPV